MQGRATRFVPSGIFNAALMVADEETRSTWMHFEGAAVYGKLQGHLLERVPAYHTTWKEWCKLHSKTEVILPPVNPIHRDCRSGHGSEESFGRPGISQNFVPTVVKPIDTRLSENALVLAVTSRGQTRIYPISEVKKEGGVVNEVLGDEPVAVWVGPDSDSFTMAAFSRRLDGEVLSFEMGNGAFRETTGGSMWNVEGKAIAGPLSGRYLEPLDFSFLRWHGWAWAHKENDIFKSQAPKGAGVEWGTFAPLIELLKGAGYDLRVEEEIVNLMRPNEADRGLVLGINGDRFSLWSFPTRTAAEDYVYTKPHSLRIGRLVIESDPEEDLKFTDTMHSRMLPDEQIAWSKLLDPNDLAGKDFLALLRHNLPEVGEKGTGLKNVLEGLTRKGYRLEVGEELKIEGIPTGRRMIEVPRSQLRVDALNAFIVYLEDDRFIVYRFRDELSAKAYCGEERHSIQVGLFVFRSTPVNMIPLKNLL